MAPAKYTSVEELTGQVLVIPASMRACNAWEDARRGVNQGPPTMKLQRRNPLQPHHGTILSAGRNPTGLRAITGMVRTYR